jgi:hypothetical protein
MHDLEFDHEPDRAGDLPQTAPRTADLERPYLVRQPLAVTMVADDGSIRQGSLLMLSTSYGEVVASELLAGPDDRLDALTALLAAIPASQPLPRELRVTGHTEAIEFRRAATALGITLIVTGRRLASRQIREVTEKAERRLRLSAQVYATPQTSIDDPLRTVGRELVVERVQVPPSLSGPCRWNVVLAMSGNGRNSELVGIEVVDADDDHAEARLIGRCLKIPRPPGVPDRIVLDNARRSSSRGLQELIVDVGATLAFRPRPDRGTERLRERLGRELELIAAATRTAQPAGSMKRIVASSLARMAQRREASANVDGQQTEGSAP